MALRMLQLNDWAVKKALKHEALAGKKLLGRGAFSAVYEGSRPNTVLKLTVDSFSYWMMNCYATRLTHHMFPKVGVNYGQIGETSMRGEEVPIYLFELERLEKLSPGGEARGLARKISKMSDHSSSKHTFGFGDERTLLAFQDMIRSRELPRRVLNALTQLENFCCNYSGSGMDMHMGNFMQRKNGELVITDPLTDMRVMRLRREQLQSRRY